MAVSSNLQSKPFWLDTFPDEDVAFGFDEGGMWFSGNASNAPYPVRTNYDIDSDTTVVVVYTFVHAAVGGEEDVACPDQGICFFKSDVEPYWSWGDDASRIAVQYDCGTPGITGQNENEMSSPYELTIGDTYTARVTYDPVAETITHELFEGSSVSGSPVNTIVLENERLPAGAYRIGFHADLDLGLPDKAYFTYLEINEGPVEVVTRVFRAMRLPRRRREVVSEEDGTPVNVPPGELLYAENENTLYIGQDDGDVVQISGSGSIGGGNPFDQDLNTTDNVTFAGVAFSNGTQVTVGSFDNSIGGQGGIALHCYLGYELNWQGGRLRNVYIGDNSGLPQTIYVDSPMEFAGESPNTLRITDAGITFPDETQQTTAHDPRWALFLPPAPSNVVATPGDGSVVLAWDAPTVLAQTPIIDRAILYSIDNGANWTEYTTAASASNTANITGLTNGTAYVFKVAVLTGIGMGPYSTPSDPVTPAA